MQQRTCQKVDEDFSKQMWSSRIIQTLNELHSTRLKNQSLRLKLKALPILLSFVTASSDVFGILIKILD